ncbi:hypothetical protein CCHL11_07812 [Colletotrichum chlorophyti]|uniref:Proteophosphoglycan ppg4 n=1 Tax=Colletotrichum chlorophyti TaxID=708187 RepID=A0A1Q8RN79_9PEZI|nr:hypothetical protein CCHL11_07812 [Colletotrichum chlorophyti]
MGNTHSTESDPHSLAQDGSPNKRSPHKLSKPRVNSYASPTSSPAAGLLSGHGRVSSSLPPSRSNPRITAPTLANSAAPTPARTSSVSRSGMVAQPQSPSVPDLDTKSVPVKEWKRRASLFRSKSSQGPRKDRTRESMMLSPPVADRMSRANSMTWESQKEMDNARQLQVESWHIPGNRQSINYNLMSYESRRLLNLSEDLTACEESSIVSEGEFEVSLNTWKSSHPLQPSSSVRVPRVDSEVSLYAPVRRRSIVQTPGVATRRPTENSASRRSSFRNSVPATPTKGQSRLNSLESIAMPVRPLTEYVAESDFLREPVMEPVERALTPSDMDYRPLGTIKFGTLRITNGAASPLPSPDFEPPVDRLAVTSYETRTLEHSAQENRTVTMGKNDAEKDASATQSSTAPGGFSPIKTSFVSAAQQRQESNSSISPAFQPISKHMVVEDNVVQDDLQTEYSAEVLTVRNDPNAKPSLERLQADQAQKDFHGVSRADSGVVTSPIAEHQPKTLSKADSGYSSNISLRSFHGKHAAMSKGQPRRAASEDSSDEESDVSSSLNAAVSNITTNPGHVNGPILLPASSASPIPPPVPPKDDIFTPAKSNTTALSSPKLFNLNASQSLRKNRKSSVVVDSHQTTETGPLSPEMIRSSAATSDISNSALSIGSGLQREGKFQRLLNGPGMRGPPAVHAIHPSDNAIPPVPQDVQAKLNEHSGCFPTPTKRLTLRHQASKDTLRTIFNIGGFGTGHFQDKRDFSPTADSNEALQNPTAEGGEPVEKIKPPRRRSLHSVPASIAHAASLVIPARSIHRKPVPSSTGNKSEYIGKARADDVEVGFEAQITSIDHVGESVGKSAFDQAFTAMVHREEPSGLVARTSTMTAQMERDVGMRFFSDKLTASPSQEDFLPLSPCLPSPDATAKRKTSPPVSMYTRSGKNVRKPVLVRPQSASSSETGQSRRQALSRQNSREGVHSYPSTSSAGFGDPLSAPPIPPMNPMRSMLTIERQYAAARREAVEDKWRPTNRLGLESGRDARPAMRSMSTTSYGAQHHQQQQLRHRSSYESYTQHRGPVAQRGPSDGQNLSQSGGYYQQQLLNIQQQQWEQLEQYPANSDHSGLHRSRSRSRSVHANGNPPYRVLHSYNSPAYRNVPIWG